MARKKKVNWNPPAARHGNEKVRPTGERPCPICKEKMKSETQQGVTVDICSEHGVWMDRGELDRMISSASTRGRASRRASIDSARRKGVVRGLFLGTWALLGAGGPAARSSRPRRGWPGKVEPPSGPDNTDLVAEGQRPCPVCDELMEVEAMENIIVDLCDAHGLWLDEDELDVMVSAARGRVRRGAASAARAAHRKGVVDANIWGLVALLG